MLYQFYNNSELLIFIFYFVKSKNYDLVLTLKVESYQSQS
jgi:hypothetical protein